MKKYLALLSLLFLTACPEAGIISSVPGYVNADDQIRLTRPPRDFVSEMSQLGQSLGYKVTGVSAVNSTITLERQASMAGTFLVGAYDTRTVTLSLQPDGRTVVIKVMVFGNLGANSQTSTQETITQYKQALSKQYL